MPDRGVGQAAGCPPGRVATSGYRMIIFGWGGGASKDLGPTFVWTCHCHNEGFLHYFYIDEVVQPFLHPTHPTTKKRHFLLCRSARDLQLNRPQAKQALRVALAYEAFINDQL